MADPAESIERRLRRRFTEFVSRRNAAVRSVAHTLDKLRMRGWTAFLFGGIPRGVLDDGNRYRPRDLDLVFDDEHFEYFESAFEHCLERKNSYGGLRLNMHGMAVDAWGLSATWAFREGLVQQVSFEMLPHTTFLNIDGLVIEAVCPPGKGRRVYQAGFSAGWRQRTLDINLRENPHPDTCLIRTLFISKRYGFNISHRLSMYLWDLLANRPLPKFEQAQAYHYGQVAFYCDQLAELRENLEAHLASSALFPFNPFPTNPDQLELGFRRPESLLDLQKADYHSDAGTVSRH